MSVVERTAEGVGHALLRAQQHVARGAHGAADQHGLVDGLVVDRDQRVMRGERARGALAVHQKRAGLAVDEVLLDLHRHIHHFEQHMS